MNSILDKVDLTHAILNNSGTLVIVANSLGQIELLNKAASRITGYSFNEIKGCSIEDIFLLGEEVALFYENFNRLTSGFQIQDFECHWKTKLEKPRLIHWSCTVVLNSDDRVEHILFFGVDITYRKISEARFASIFTNVKVGIVTVDLTGFVQEVNPAFTTITGIASSEIIGQHITDLANRYFKPDDLPAISKKIAKLLAQKKVSSSEIIFQEKTLVIDLVQEVIQGDFAIIIRDITKQRIADRNIEYRIAFEKLIANISTKFINLPLSQIDNELNTALKQVGIFEEVDHSYIIQIDKDGEHVNNTHEWSAKGIQPAMELNQDVPIESFPWCFSQLEKIGYIHVPDVKKMPVEAKNEKLFFESQGVQSLVMVPMVQDETYVGLLGLDSFQKLKTWSEDSIRLLQIVADTFISAIMRLKTGLILQERETLLQTILQTAPIGIALIRDRKVEWANETVTTMLEYQNEEVSELALQDFFVNEEDFQHIRQLIKNKKDLYGFECGLKQKTGKRFDIVFNSAVLPIESEEPTVIFTAMDISDIKKTEIERENLIAELEKKNDELERFTYMVSHDLKSPLITIKGFMNLLEKDVTKEDKTQLHVDMEHILHAVDTMTEMLNDLLELSRIGRIMHPYVPCSLFDLANEAVKMIDGRLKGKNITINIDPQLPTIEGDKIRLFEVFLNLLDNAAKFMETQESPLIEVGFIKNGDKFVYYVKDNGKGIDVPFQKKIFDLFDKLQPDIEGTGIGLTIVKRIIDLHNGRIWVESKGKNCGSIFYFTLWDDVQNVDVGERK